MTTVNCTVCGSPPTGTLFHNHGEEVEEEWIGLAKQCGILLP